jgi:hypothetical protein
MLDTDIAYLAGIIDGEGTITLAIKNGSGKQVGAKWSRPLVHVVNTDLALLGWIEERFGGYLYDQPIGKASDRSKPCYRLSWGGPEAIEIVTTVLPYLVVKRAQADVLLRFADTYSATRYGRGGLPEAVKDQRLGLVTEIRSLNKKGRAV